MTKSELKRKLESAVPEKAPHEECYLDYCEMCAAPQGWNACRQAMLAKIEELLKSL